MENSDNSVEENEEMLFCIVEYDLCGQTHTTRKVTKPGNMPEKSLVETCLFYFR